MLRLCSYSVHHKLPPGVPRLVLRNLGGVALDKSEGFVKQHFCAAVVSRVGLPEKVEDQDPGNLTLNHSRRNIVPPTIDSAYRERLATFGRDAVP